MLSPTDICTVCLAPLRMCKIEETHRLPIANPTGTVKMLTDCKQRAECTGWGITRRSFVETNTRRTSPLCDVIRSWGMFKRPKCIRSSSKRPYRSGSKTIDSSQPNGLQPPWSVQRRGPFGSQAVYDPNNPVLGVHPTLVISTELKSGQRFRFEVVPEVAYHVLEEFREGMQQVHFEDICEKPVTLSCRHLKWIKVDPLRTK